MDCDLDPVAKGMNVMDRHQERKCAVFRVDSLEQGFRGIKYCRLVGPWNSYFVLAHRRLKQIHPRIKSLDLVLET